MTNLSMQRCMASLAEYRISFFKNRARTSVLWMNFLVSIVDLTRLLKASSIAVENSEYESLKTMQKASYRNCLTVPWLSASPPSIKSSRSARSSSCPAGAADFLVGLLLLAPSPTSAKSSSTRPSNPSSASPPTFLIWFWAEPTRGTD